MVVLFAFIAGIQIGKSEPRRDLAPIERGW
jgi:hypothetical protein